MDDNFKELIQKDTKLSMITDYEVIIKDKDPNHYERRKQQRAITEQMVAVCLGYGLKKYIRGAKTYTLLDKSLKGTPYIKYIEKLRGLRVVLNNLPNASLGIETVYWVYEVKKRR